MCQSSKLVAFMKLSRCLWLTIGMLLAGCKPGMNAADNLDLAANLNAPFDYYITGMRTERFGADGKQIMLLTATRANHFPSDDHIELDHPVVHWSRDNAEPWIVTANEGNLHHKGDVEEYTLLGSVKANTTSLQTGNMLLETDKLSLLPKTKVATTDAEVLFSKPALRLQSRGMLLDLSGNTISLNEARGTHAP